MIAELKSFSMPHDRPFKAFVEARNAINHGIESGEIILPADLTKVQAEAVATIIHASFSLFVYNDFLGDESNLSSSSIKRMTSSIDKLCNSFFEKSRRNGSVLDFRDIPEGLVHLTSDILSPEAILQTLKQLQAVCLPDVGRATVITPANKAEKESICLPCQNEYTGELAKNILDNILKVYAVHSADKTLKLYPEGLDLGKYRVDDKTWEDADKTRLIQNSACILIDRKQFEQLRKRESLSAVAARSH